MFATILNYHADLKGKRRVGEKSPQHALHLETLREWFPDSLIIHMMRDPRASVASMLHMPWSRGSVVANAPSMAAVEPGSATVSRSAGLFRGPV